MSWAQDYVFLANLQALSSLMALEVLKMYLIQ